jgi:hypothetical protein
MTGLSGNVFSPALYADGPNGSFRVHAVRGGLGACLGNSLLKTGPTDPGPDGPAVRRSVVLPPICKGGCGCPGYMSIGIP